MIQVLFSSMWSYIKRNGNFRAFKDPLEFLAEVLQHVLPPNFHSVRYYGAYSNAARGKRNRRLQERTQDDDCDCEIPINMPDPAPPHSQVRTQSLGTTSRQGLRSGSSAVFEMRR